MRSKEGVGQGPFKVCLWRNGWGNFFNLISFKVGDESRIRFWHDVRYEEAALKSSFLELYLIARDKEALVSDYLDSSNSYIQCNPSFFFF
jgi:hypothetical protein